MLLAGRSGVVSLQDCKSGAAGAALSNCPHCARAFPDSRFPIPEPEPEPEPEPRAACLASA